MAEASDRSILCGSALGKELPPSEADTVDLRMWGDKPNINFRIEDVREATWQEFPDRYLDLLDIATYVYCADQRIGRGGNTDVNFGQSWRRSLHFAIPVREPDFWKQKHVLDTLVATLSFLSEDSYTFHFEPCHEPPKPDRYFCFLEDRFGRTVEDVVLMSGGLDSCAGAVEFGLRKKRQVALVNHRPNPKLEPVLQGLARQLSAKIPERPPILLPVQINKAGWRATDSNQRSRSFLFVSLGGVLAMMYGLDRVHLCENGVLSLNLPLATQVVGARASRTTHPKVLRGFSKLLSLVAGKPFSVENPFMWETKADVIRMLGDADCGDLIEYTRSCADPRRSSKEQPHCGVCSQCIDRRFGVLAAGLEAHDPANAYGVDLLTGAREKAPDQMMAALYVELARRISRMSHNAFFGRFGETSRVLTAFDESPEVTGQRVYELARKHAKGVVEVIEGGISRHARELLNRELPATCLLQMVFEKGDDTPEGSDSNRPASHTAESYFRRKGKKSFEVRFNGGKNFLLEVSLGGAYLHILLSNPGRVFSPSELICRVYGNRERYPLHQSGQTISEEALRKMRERAKELKQDIDEAKDRGDAKTHASLREELDTIADTIRTSTNRQGKPRKETDQRERNRKAVSNAVKRAIDEIKEHDTSFATHLEKPNLTRGSELSYSSDFEWETESL